jgi:two-component system sensor histidine kinase DesK
MSSVGSPRTGPVFGSVESVSTAGDAERLNLVTGRPSRSRVHPRWMFAGIWLVYLVPTFGTAWQVEQPVRRVLGLLVVIGFAALYLYTFGLSRGRRWRGSEVEPKEQAVILISSVALIVIGCRLIGEDALAMTVYLAVSSVLLLPYRLSLLAVGATITAVEISGRTIPGWQSQDSLAFSIFLAALAIWGISQMITRNVQLALAHEEIARLAVAQERSRFARDMHDLLGHSLTVVTVKAELAGRLVALDPQQAEKEIADVERLARDALADVRAAVSGYREVTLATELLSARTALEAAGITAELPGAVDHVSGERRELFGWAVREGATNVVRHSGASRCRILLTSAAVEIIDDGAGPPRTCPDGELGPDGELRVGRVEEVATPAPARLGTGLIGLRERADVVGAAVTVGRVGPEGGFRLKVGW